MASKKSLERACLVNDRDTKRYSLTLSSNGSNSDQENHHEEPVGTGIHAVHHCHSYSKGYERRKREQHEARLRLCVATVICIIIMVAEIIGGHVAGSLAVITDAAHVLVDLMSFLISILSLWLSSKSPSKRLTYGWHRAEILGALFSMIIIWVVTGVLTYLAILRLLHPQYEIEATVMLITSGCAVIANIILSLMLHHKGGGNLYNVHQSSDGRSDPERTLASSNASVRAAFIHAVGDLFQSISVLISALIIFLKPEYKMADPICTFVFSLLVLGTTCAMLRDILLVLMEGMPKGMSYKAVKERILTVDKVESVHSLHVWSLTMNQPVLSAHIVTDTANKQQILNEITELLIDTYNFYTVTLQIEPKADQQPDCVFCQDPRD
ncbi:proton-coupled zinc antiporter SLC30A8 isoform X2 [Anolis carolinensis]|uniref:Proton-coupled zinc antiporter SLC30A8 n=1 Tax=Anolis carolinensis TaxID=28377 RepID=G1KKM1_ANOCA|nr:PREDICTED: zinc transporter 8 [Anolis carolinensis]|eukprot:XP_003219509.1 PREDICTED: zinc transporter 8 [Anolis carolinensis]